MHRDTTRIPTSPRPASPLLAWAAVLLIAGLALAAAAFTRPAGEQAGYGQDVDLTYSAAADPAVYDGGRLRTGDPVYLRLVQRLEVQVGYRLMAGDVGRATGTIGLDARLSAADGWQRTLRVAAPMRFAGPRAGMVAQVDLTTIQAVLRRAQDRTQSDGTYWVDLVPRVSLDAVVDGERHSLTTAPAFGFRYDDSAFVPDAGRSGARGAPMTDTSTSAPRAAAQISIGGRGVDVGTARIVSLALALAAMLMAGFGLLHRPKSRQPVTDRAGHRAIEVEEAELVPPAVDVHSLDDLLDVAERYDRPLMHVRTGQGETFLVEDRGVRYRFGRTALLPVTGRHEGAPAGPAGSVAEPQERPAPEPEPQPLPEDDPLVAPEPEPLPEHDPLAAPDPALEPVFAAELAKARESFAVDGLLDRDLTLDVEEHARPHRARHRQPVDLTVADEATDHPDPVAAALRASASAVPAQRRPADRQPRFRVGDSQEGVEQLRSWLRT